LTRQRRCTSGRCKAKRRLATQYYSHRSINQARILRQISDSQTPTQRGYKLIVSEATETFTRTTISESSKLSFKYTYLLNACYNCLKVYSMLSGSSGPSPPPPPGGRGTGFGLSHARSSCAASNSVPPSGGGRTPQTAQYSLVLGQYPGQEFTYVVCHLLQSFSAYSDLPL
jgi:hypothetical protein